MTETTGVSTEFTVDLSISHAQASDVTFGDAIEYFDDLRSLTGVGYFMQLKPHFKPVASSMSEALLDTERYTRIRAISYQSPLEVVVTLMAASGAALAVANRIISLHNRFQQARLIKSNVDVRLVANEVIREEIAARNLHFELPDGPELQPEIRAAGRALDRITNIEMNPYSDGSV